MLRQGDYVNIEGIDKETHTKLCRAFIKAGANSTLEDENYPHWRNYGLLGWWRSGQLYHVLKEDMRKFFTNEVSIKEVLEEEEPIGRDMKNIDVSRPEDYTYDGKEVVSITQLPSEAYSVVFRWNSMYDHQFMWGIELEEKPKWEPEVGKWYYFYDRDDGAFTIDVLIGILKGDEYPYETENENFKHCRPIPAEIYKNMVFEEDI